MTPLDLLSRRTGTLSFERILTRAVRRCRPASDFPGLSELSAHRNEQFACYAMKSDFVIEGPASKRRFSPLAGENSIAWQLAALAMLREGAARCAARAFGAPSVKEGGFLSQIPARD